MLLINKNTILLKLKILKPTFQFDFILYKDFSLSYLHKFE